MEPPCGRGRGRAHGRCGVSPPPGLLAGHFPVNTQMGKFPISGFRDAAAVLASGTVGETEIAEGLLHAATETLRPLVRRLLSAGVPFGQLESRLRRLYVETADRECSLPERRQTVSRIALLTGINRKEVKRLRAAPSERPAAPSAFGRNLAASLVSRWMRDARTARRGRPRPIPYQAVRGPSFVKLALATTVDLPARAFLDALVANGVAEVRRDGRVALTASAYLPRRGRSGALAMLAEDPPDLVATMLHNVLDVAAEPLLQRRIAYDHVGADGLPHLRDELRRASERFVHQIDRVFSRYDRDRNPRAAGGERRRAGLGLYYFESAVGAPDALPPAGRRRSRKEAPS